MKPVALLLAVIVVHSVAVDGIQPEELSFELRVGGKQCFTDTYLSNVHIVGEVLVVDGSPDMTVSYEISDVRTKQVLRAREHVGHDSFSFNAPHIPGSHDVSAHDAHSVHNRPSHSRQPGSSDFAAATEPREYQLCFTGSRPRDWHHPQTHDRHGLPPLPTRKIFVSFREAADVNRIAGQRELKNMLTRKSDLDGVEKKVDQIVRQVTRLTREIDELRYREHLLAESGEYTASRIHRYSFLACFSIAVAGVVSTYSAQVVLSKSSRR